MSATSLVISTLAIPPDVCSGLRRFAHAAEVSIEAVLLAAHMFVISTLAGEDEPRTMVLGQDRRSAAFRLTIGEDSWRTLARRVHTRIAPALTQTTEADDGPQPATRFYYMKAPDLEDPAVRTIASFRIDPATGDPVAALAHAAATSPARRQQTAGIYARTLAAMAADPGASCRASSPLDPTERQRLLVDFNRPGAAQLPAAGRRFLELFADHVARSPDTVAVVDPSGELEYRRLDARAADLALRLRAAGVAHGAVVGVCVPRTAALPTAFLGVLAAGATYLPLDPDYPPERLAYILADAGVAAIVSVPALSERLAGAQCPRIMLGDGEQPAGLAADTAPVADDDLAYIIYTSGTTDHPRGVQVPHRGLANLAAAQIHAFAVTPGARVLQFASPGFDASISEILMALGSGAALHMPGDTSLARTDIAGLLQRRAITHVTLSPSLLAVLPDVALPALTSLVCAGEVCPPQLAARWGPGRRFFNAYGPTEATVCATIAEISAADAAGATLPIGAPIPGVRVYVLDDRQALVPLGTPGELCIGGIGVARGYHRQPASDAAKFVPDPFGPGKLYRTGDVVRFRDDGRLEFIGRRDEQLKLRGHRVEPAEIAAVLRAHPGVGDAVVVAHDTDAGKQLVASVVHADDITEGDLLAHLAARVPAYMMPARVVRLASMPTTAHGKIDRAALPGPFAAKPTTPPAQTDLELQIADIWRDVLQVAQVGRDDNFFELGGHSLLMMLVLARLQPSHPGIELVALFDNPTVGSLAAHCSLTRTPAHPPAP